MTPDERRERHILVVDDDDRLRKLIKEFLNRAGFRVTAAPDAAGETHVALVNDRLNLGFEVTTRRDQLPCLYEWQNLQAGSYALGIEPSTHHVLGNDSARQRGEMIWLEHDESRSYDAVFRVLDGAGEIERAERRIHSIAQQPDDDYPVPSGAFAVLGDRG